MKDKDKKVGCCRIIDSRFKSSIKKAMACFENIWEKIFYIFLSLLSVQVHLLLPPYTNVPIAHSVEILFSFVALLQYNVVFINFWTYFFSLREIQVLKKPI